MTPAFASAAVLHAVPTVSVKATYVPRSAAGTVVSATEKSRMCSFGDRLVDRLRQRRLARSQALPVGRGGGPVGQVDEQAAFGVGGEAKL